MSVDFKWVQHVHVGAANKYNKRVWELLIGHMCKFYSFSQEYCVVSSAPKIKNHYFLYWVILLKFQICQQVDLREVFSAQVLHI